MAGRSCDGLRMKSELPSAEALYRYKGPAVCKVPKVIGADEVEDEAVELGIFEAPGVCRCVGADVGCDPEAPDGGSVYGGGSSSSPSVGSVR